MGHSQSSINAVVVALVNGEATRCLDIADRGLQYGDGVFTTFPVVGGHPVFLARHLARLQADTARLSLPFPGAETLLRDLDLLIPPHADAVVKILLTRGGGGRGYRCPDKAAGTRILTLHPMPAYPDAPRVDGVHVRLCETRLAINPRLAGIKHLNRLEQILARAEWQDEQIAEGLLLDYEGYLVEGVMSNLFWVERDILRTPLLQYCGVKGVMRGIVIESALSLGIPTEEVREFPQSLARASEMFLTNSVIGIWPVRQWQDRPLPAATMTRQLIQRVDEMMAEDRAASVCPSPNPARD